MPTPSSQSYETFLEALSVIVNGDGPYQEKLATLRSYMSDDDLTNIQELASWFTEE